EVEGDQRGAAAGAGRPDRIVELLEPADGARHRHHMGAGARERKRGCSPDAPRGAGDEGDAVGKGKHYQPQAMRILRMWFRFNTSEPTLASLFDRGKSSVTTKISSAHANVTQSVRPRSA